MGCLLKITYFKDYYCGQETFSFIKYIILLIWDAAT